ncbi:YHS domain-containing protein [bacterium CPR1]|nr:YHS domain-containing protein [bacterium CPR1]
MKQKTTCTQGSCSLPASPEVPSSLPESLLAGDHEGMKIDPVCGMKVDPETDLTHDHHGERFYFCSQKCREKFQATPEKYSVEKAAGTRHPDRNYQPLVVLLVLVALSATARQLAAPEFEGAAWMHDFMGLFLVVFSMFKLFDLKGFANGYSMYDLLARRWRGWAYVYPFLELGLGLGYLAHWQPMVIYSATVVLLAFGALGVLSALRRGLDVDCACMGTVLHVPLSTVALLEDVGMAAMAGSMLLMRA